DFLKEKTSDKIFGSKDATRLAFKYELVDEGEIWMGMIGDRNISSHTYNEDVADQIAKAVVSKYITEFRKFGNTMTSLKENN
ncbi:MAG: nucleotidyltransferase substrate binding protein, partial [Pricia sp.]